VLTCDVGDRRVVEEMRRSGAPLGGEQSGHVILGPPLAPPDGGALVGDGIRTALCVLRALRETGAPLSALVAPYTRFPQVLLNVPVREKPELTSVPGVAELVSEVEAELGEDGRVLLRYSGTESLARVMVEGPDEGHIRGRARDIAAAIEAALGAA
jgi:phosphoglucosamine mutase